MIIIIAWSSIDGAHQHVKIGKQDKTILNVIHQYLIDFKSIVKTVKKKYNVKVIFCHWFFVP
jgi:hypothetical protein